ncbi:MAG: hypothetical protein K0U78_20960 [Actinomycetia bacterium]|nr:hypothetical protein [Actinomycetes bacterium]
MDADMALQRCAPAARAVATTPNRTHGRDDHGDALDDALDTETKCQRRFTEVEGLLGDHSAGLCGSYGTAIA